MVLKTSTEKTWRDFKMPFGKYKGRTINEIRLIDLQYCAWAAEELSSGSLRELFLTALEYSSQVDPIASAQVIDRYRRRNDNITRRLQ